MVRSLHTIMHVVYRTELAKSWATRYAFSNIWHPRVTNDDGRASAFLTWDQFLCAHYKMRFEVGEYFASHGVETFFPYAEVGLQVEYWTFVAKHKWKNQFQTCYSQICLYFNSFCRSCSTYLILGGIITSRSSWVRTATPLIAGVESMENTQKIDDRNIDTAPRSVLCWTVARFWISLCCPMASHCLPHCNFRENWQKISQPRKSLKVLPSTRVLP